MTPWTIANARQNLSTVIDNSLREAQPIYRRKQLVAAVINADTFEDLQKQNKPCRTIAQAFEELESLTDTEQALPEVKRYDRPNPFADTEG